MNELASGVLDGADTDDAEMTAAAGTLGERFARNLELLRRIMPDGYVRFADYRPRRYHLRWVEGHGTTIVDGASGDPIYPGNALSHAETQVAEFRASPRHRRCNFVPKNVLQVEKTLHVRNVNAAVERLNAVERDPVDGLPEFANLMMVFGLGAGHHVEALLADHDVHHLCIVEPDPDLFHAALHTVEWTAIVEHFSRTGYSLEIVLGETAANGVQQIAEWLEQIGGFNAVQPYLFRHLRSENLDETYDGFLNHVMPRFTGSLGYFDDERVGLAHTLANVEARIPVLRESVVQSGIELDRPAFVVANGPSLDLAIDFLRENRDRAVVFSCGTALGSLAKAGILPDIHIEMERTRPVVEWIQQATTAEQRKQFRLIGLNTVHPEVFRLFDQRGIVAKPNDIGSLWMARHVRDGGALPAADECNPTVGNCGLAVATALGFKELTVFGMDLGYPAGRQHHSSLSVHYDVKDEHQDTLGVYRYDDPANPIAHGNFGGEIRTTPVYVTAARAVGMLKMKYPHLTIRNTADGLLMPGTEPTRVEDLEVGEAFDTSAFVEELWERGFRKGGITTPTARDRRDIASAAGALAEEIAEIFAIEAPDRANAMVLPLLANMHLEQRASDRSVSTAAAIVRGSLAHFSLILAQALHQRNDESEAMSLHGACLQDFLRFLSEVAELSGSPAFYALDTRTRDLARKVER